MQSGSKRSSNLISSQTAARAAVVNNFCENSTFPYTFSKWIRTTHFRDLRPWVVLRTDSVLFKKRLYVFVNAGNCDQDSIRSAGNGVPLKIKTARLLSKLSEAESPR